MGIVRSYRKLILPLLAIAALLCATAVSFQGESMFGGKKKQPPAKYGIVTVDTDTFRLYNLPNEVPFLLQSGESVPGSKGT